MLRYAWAECYAEQMATVSTRLVQLTHPDEGRRAALVYGGELHLLATYRSAYSFAMAALETGWKLRDLLSTDLSGITLNYEEVHSLATPWRFLPAFDHPEEPGRCLVSAAGPPWRYVGSGASLRGHGDAIAAGSCADIAAVYVIGRDGEPHRVGVTPGFCSRHSAIGPELTLDTSLPAVEGTVASDGQPIKLSAGDVPLAWILTSVEPDLFEATDSRRLGDAHVHFFAERLFDSRPAVEGDAASVEFQGLGRALRNRIRSEKAYRVAAVPL